MKNEGF